MTCDKEHNNRIKIYGWCDLCKTSKIEKNEEIEKPKKKNRFF